MLTSVPRSMIWCLASHCGCTMYMLNAPTTTQLALRNWNGTAIFLGYFFRRFSRASRKPARIVGMSRQRAPAHDSRNLFYLVPYRTGMPPGRMGMRKRRTTDATQEPFYHASAYSMMSVEQQIRSCRSPTTRCCSSACRPTRLERSRSDRKGAIGQGDLREPLDVLPGAIPDLVGQMAKHIEADALVIGAHHASEIDRILFPFIDVPVR